MNAKEKLMQFGRKITPAYLTKVAVLTAISFILYLLLKFSLPFIFPSFLDMQFSELPAILAGFSLGPVAGVVVIILKCLLKFPFSGTAFVGEITDMILGILYVLPASIYYCHNKSKRNAVIGLIIGTIFGTAGALLLNRFVSVPFYVEFFFGGNFDVIVTMCAPLYPSMTRDTFYLYYLSAAVLPFNLLRLGLVSVITFLVYKSLSKALHWEIKRKTSETNDAEMSALETKEEPTKSYEADSDGDEPKDEERKTKGTDIGDK